MSLFIAGSACALCGLLCAFVISCDGSNGESKGPPGYHELSIDPETGEIVPAPEPSTVARIQLSALPDFETANRVMVVVENIQQQPILFDLNDLSGPQITADSTIPGKAPVNCGAIVHWNASLEPVQLAPGETTRFTHDFSDYIRSCRELHGSQFRTGKYNLSLMFSIESELVESEPLQVTLSGN